jgi:O-antigen ligase
VEYTKILLMAAMLALVIEKVWQVNLMVMVVTLAVGYIAWEVNALYLFDGRLDIYHNGYGGLDNNGAGLMIAMGVPLAYGFVAGSNRLWLKGAAAFAAVLMIHAVMMTYSRGAMLALVVTAIWILVHHRPRMQAVGLAVVLLVVVSVLAGPQIRHRFFSTTSYHQDDSAQSRLASWKAAWEMTMDAPLTGQGLRNANKFTYTYGADRYGRTIHSQYLQIAADSGLPALAAYLAVLTLAFFNATRVRRLSLQHLRRGGDDPPTGDAPHPLFNTSVRQIAAMALGLQSSLLTFAFGGLFLSLEVFELPWLLIALAGIWPMLLERHLASLPSAALPEPEPAPQGRRGASPKRWSARRRASLPLTKKVVHP